MDVKVHWGPDLDGCNERCQNTDSHGENVDGEPGASETKQGACRGKE